ncbi:hypothetical protein PV726_39350 [Streptomyces europaeiscabiei]|nr:hypothetical protein [Streptomyces europaeiscabiei]MDX3696265.1 hypothetical protein [Streptomyces europaeiscabiei]
MISAGLAAHRRIPRIRLPRQPPVRESGYGDDATVVALPRAEC